MKPVLFFIFFALTSLKGQGESQSPISSHLLRPGDVLDINVYEHPELSLRTRVDADSTIIFPLCGSVKVGQRTAGEIAKLLSRELNKANIENAQVFVYIVEYTPRYIYVLGAVQGDNSNVQEIPPEGRITALQAVSAAGGFTEQADLQNVFVLRVSSEGKKLRLPVDVSGVMSMESTVEDISLLPGDTVVIPTASPVSVLGMVSNPGAFSIDTVNSVTAAQIISMAGGFKPGADRDQTLLWRKTDDTQSIQKIPMGKFSLGKDSEAHEVKPGDIIIASARDKIFVLGQVRQAGAFDIMPEIPMTVTRAIALAGGFDRLAAESAILLIRGTKAEKIDLKKVLRHDGDVNQDRYLEPGDIVFVAESRW